MDRGSECDIGKNKLSIVPPPIYTLLATTDHLTVLAENHVTSPSPPPSPKNPFLTPLVESTFGGIYDYQFE